MTSVQQGSVRRRTKKCFIITSIGKEGSEIRDRSDHIVEYIIKPALEGLNYEGIRADQISEPGIINVQILTHLVEDELAIADLTSKNPNVFFELGIRQAFGKNSVHIIDSDETPPFDLAPERVIVFKHSRLTSARHCTEDIR